MPPSPRSGGRWASYSPPGPNVTFSSHGGDNSILWFEQTLWWWWWWDSDDANRTITLPDLLARPQGTWRDVHSGPLRYNVWSSCESSSSALRPAYPAEPLSALCGALFALLGLALVLRASYGFTCRLASMIFCARYIELPRNPTDRLGALLMVLNGAVLVSDHLLGVALTALLSAAMRALFLCWFLETWLRRVAQQPLLLRILAIFILPAGQGLLVRFAYRYMPRSDRLDRYTTGVLRYAWPLLLLLVAFKHAKLAEFRKSFAAWAFVFLAAAAVAAATDRPMCDDLGPVAEGYWLGSLWAAHLSTALGFMLLLFASQAERLSDVTIQQEHRARRDGRGRSSHSLPREQTMAAELMAAELFAEPLPSRVQSSDRKQKGPAKRCVSSSTRSAESLIGMPDPSVLSPIERL